MTHFKPGQFKINPEKSGFRRAGDQSDTRIIKVDDGGKPQVQEFELNNLNQNPPTYSEVKAKYGALAITDSERDNRSERDRRFSINSLLRDPLSIEEEERRIIGEKVRARVDALSEDARAQASAVGYEEGLQKGFEEAFKKFTVEGAENLEKFQEMVEAAENLKKDLFRVNERFLIELVYRIARMVLLKEVAVDREYVLRLAKELISRVGARDNITLKINSEDSKTLESLKEGLKKNFGEMNNLNIEVSSQVQRGGCRLETEWNAIDARVETQLEGIYRELADKV